MANDVNGKQEDDEQSRQLLRLVEAVVVHVRYMLYQREPMLAVLLDAIENIPRLLAAGVKVDINIVRSDIVRIEEAMPELKGRFSRFIPPNE